MELYDHQKLAVEQLKNGSILMGGVGSGKSLTAIAYFFTKVCKGEFDTNLYSKPKNPKDLYIITTAKKRDSFDWEKECAPFILSVDQKLSVCGIKVTIDSWNNIAKYEGVKNAFFIFDEQRVVGSGAWVKKFLKITKSNKWILLSATPGDTWIDYVPVFVANGYFKNRTEFLRKHVVYKPFMNYPVIDHYVGVNLLSKYRNDILVEMKFERSTVRHDVQVTVEFNKDLFKEVLKNRWNPFTDSPIVNSAEFCQVLRRIVNMSEDRVDKVKDILKTNGSGIVFYNFNYELDMLRKMCKDHGIIFSEWNGQKHQPIPEKKDKTWCYLVQYAAGAEGWNCIETDTLIFYSLNHSYKMTEQASGRIDRLNTPFTDLYFYKLISKSWIDKSIQNCLEEKKVFNNERFEKDMDILQKEEPQLFHAL